MQMIKSFNHILTNANAIYNICNERKKISF
nr:MAG TPA: hypothetical protein [Caudoviricetes sp.]